MDRSDFDIHNGVLLRYQGKKMSIRVPTINIPQGVREIPDFAFQNCSKLRRIELNEGLTSIGKCTFGYCQSLTTLVLPEGLTKLAYQG